MGLITTTLMGSPRAESTDDLDVLWSQSPPEGSILTLDTAGLIHSAYLNTGT